MVRHGETTVIATPDITAFGNDGIADQKILKAVFAYENGRLFWSAKMPRNRHAGAEAGYVNSNGYRMIEFAGKRRVAHRFIWVMHYGEWPDEIDHINGERSDNRIENLRSVTRLENMRNRKVQKNSTSGVNGVCWVPKRNAWVASIWVQGKRVYLGDFKSIEQAAEARKTAEQKYGFHANHGRTSHEPL